jgi:antibiotic biosynthesis monooxygenase (ABM) superfamily enzyme
MDTKEFQVTAPCFLGVMLSSLNSVNRMITRIWRGWTTTENAPRYEALLLSEIFPAITQLAIAGYRGISLLKRQQGHEVEFVTIMRFDDLEAVKTFAGDNYESAVIPRQARTLLSRFDERSAHYEELTPPASTHGAVS